MQSEMTHKERIMAAIEHKPLDRIPIDYCGTPEITNKLMRELNVKDFNELVKVLDLDKILGVKPDYIGPESKNGIRIVDFHDIFGNKVDTDEFLYDYWGVKFKKVVYADGGGVYYEMCSHPLENLNSIAEIEEHYTWPKPEWFDYSKIEKRCSEFPDYAIQCSYMALFFIYNNIRGLSQSLIDLAMNEELAHYIIEKILDFYYKSSNQILEAGNGKIDISEVTDDFGTQNGLMISVDMFNKYFRDGYSKLIKLVKSYDIKVLHHDDGSIMDLIPELVDIGIDILNPIQWHLPGMDIKKLKENFGEKICFHGAIDNQKVLPFGTVSEVENEVIKCIDVLGSNKTGYILAPCHNLQINTPIENIIKMYDVAKTYGKF